MLLSIKGTIGRVGTVPSGFRGNISRDIGLLRTDATLSSPFLALFLKSEEGQRQLRRIAVGTTRAELSIHALREVRVPIPEGTKQSWVVDMVRSVEARRRAEGEKLRKLRTIQAGIAVDLLSGRVRTVAA